VSVTLGSYLTDPDNGFGASNGSTDIYVRMDVTGTFYVRCVLGRTRASLFYCLGNGVEVQIGTTATSGITQATGNVYTLVAGDYPSLTARKFQLYQTTSGTTTLVATWTDTTSALGAAYQGWGFGATLGGIFSSGYGFVNFVPASISAVVVTDPANVAAGVNSGEIVILPTALAGQTTQTAATTLYVMLQSSNQADVTKRVTASALQPGLAVVPLPWGP
jgi:hypothetical protein